MTRVDQLLSVLASSGKTLPALEIAKQMDLSQPVVSRLIARAGDSVVRIGRGRATRYAASRDLFGCGPRVPLFAVDEAGLIDQVADLWPLATGQYFVETSIASPFWLRGEGGTGLHSSLPYFLHDLRPAGFVGRQIARELAVKWGVSPDPRNWDDRQIGRYLVQRGDDLPGNLVVGAAAAEQTNANSDNEPGHAPSAYPDLAERALAEGVPGSSAAGEQPKFAIWSDHTVHVIVKFSPASDSADAVRWRDLLLAEAHALAHLRAQGLPAAEALAHELGSRIFLESRRFDRVGRRGRLPSISLGMVDAEFVGEGQSWSRVGQGLCGQGLLAKSSAQTLAWLETFGSWIGNSDMHLGNITLRPGIDMFSLHPIYDMLPMRFAPARGELPKVHLRPPIRTRANEDVWASAGECATLYWGSLAETGRLSDDFRFIADAQAREWRKLLGTQARTRDQTP